MEMLKKLLLAILIANVTVSVNAVPRKTTVQLQQDKMRVERAERREQAKITTKQKRASAVEQKRNIVILNDDYSDDELRKVAKEIVESSLDELPAPMQSDIHAIIPNTDVATITQTQPNTTDSQDSEKTMQSILDTPIVSAFIPTPDVPQEQVSRAQTSDAFARLVNKVRSFCSRHPRAVFYLPSVGLNIYNNVSHGLITVSPLALTVTGVTLAAEIGSRVARRFSNSIVEGDSATSIIEEEPKE